MSDISGKFSILIPGFGKNNIATGNAIGVAEFIKFIGMDKAA